MDDTLKCYKVLDLEPGASAERVRRSYVELSHVWDPARYANNPVLRERAEQKRKEITDAYEALRVFLPELQGGRETPVKKSGPERDFKEMTTETPVESTRAIMGFIVALILLGMFAFAFYLLHQGRHVTPPVEPVSVPVE